MSQYKLLSMTFLIVATLCVKNFAGDVDLSELRTRKVRTAVSAYKKKIDSARKDYEKTTSSAKMDFEEVVNKERDKLIVALEDGLKQETSNGNLDEAVKLKSAIESLTNQAAVASQQPGQILGLWKIKYHDGLVRYNQFIVQNGQPAVLHYVDPREKATDKGTAVVEDGMVLVKYENFPAIERFHFNADRLFVERWNITGDSSIDRYPDLFRIATKSEPQNE